ncbi:flagellar hook-basal body complex protein [Magnetovibrio sp.]|uniref:flagellar hook protein FlgE n=1 Tax=Magnetovibrio sp. TaxID=2024836 RepID=UPI002F91E001
MVSGILNAAVSGLSLNAQHIGAAADNIVNVSTTGYKRTDLNAKSIATRQTTTAYAPGGVQTVARPQNGVQGLLASSTSNTDLALSGAGYFAVSTSVSTVSPQGASGDESLFTRDGSFAADNRGYLVNNSGHYLLANRPDGSGGLSPVNVHTIGGTAAATTSIEVGANLPATANVGERFTVNARATDSLGAQLDIPLTFEAQAGGAYRLSIGVITETATGATVAVAREGSNAGPAYDVTVQFSADGTVAGFDGGTQPPVLNIAGLSSGAQDLNIQIDLGTVGEANGLTRYGTAFQLGSVQSDGARFGAVSNVTISTDGQVTAVFDNGETRDIARIPVATFTNPSGLLTESGGVYRATDASGAPTYLAAGSGGAGQVQSGALELSTTDLGTEFANLLVAKTSYRASLEVLKAADQLSKSLLDEIA